jgi:hypothetical protein
LNLINAVALIAIPIYFAMWILIAILSIRYRRKLKSEYPEECKARGGLRHLKRFLRRREYREFGNEEFILESELLRIASRIWFFVFFTTMAILITFFITNGMS